MDVEKILGRMSYHVVYDDSILDSISFASRNGFSGVQISMESPHLAFEKISDSEIAEIRDLSRKMNIRINLHAPDTAVLTFPCPDLNKGVLKYYSDLIDFAGKIDAAIITVHPGSPTTFVTDTIPQEEFPKQDIALYKEIFEENLKQITELAKGKACICIENCGLRSFFLEILQECINKNAGLRLCWDIEKTYNNDGSLNQEIKGFMDRNRAAVRQVHLHSLVNGHGHKVIQVGLIDFRYYLDLLRDVDILDYCIEVRPREKAVESLENLKKILGI